MRDIVDAIQTGCAYPTLDGYELASDSMRERGPWAKAARPYPFLCRVCGQSYESIWVGKHTSQPICDRCVIAARKADERRPASEPYPMPRMYALDGSALLQPVKAWAYDPSAPLALLVGGPGRGKTAQAHHIAALAHRWGRTYKIISDRTIAMLGQDDIADLGRLDMLILDEIGRRTTEGAIAGACDILDARTPHGRKTAVVSNLSGVDLAQLDARLFSRLKEATRIAFEGPDMRGGQKVPQRGGNAAVEAAT